MYFVEKVLGPDFTKKQSNFEVLFLNSQSTYLFFALLTGKSETRICVKKIEKTQCKSFKYSNFYVDAGFFREEALIR